MRIVVTGHDGQVVRSLIERGAVAGHDIVPLGRPELDLTSDAKLIMTALERSRPDFDTPGDLDGHPGVAAKADFSQPESLAVLVRALRPDVIVNAAAHTAVDKAESEVDLAFAVNAAGTGAVAAAAHQLAVPMVHLSTDYVFDGAKSAPYVETDATGPTGVYGASKLAGELAVLAAHDNAAILRTAWVYSPFGSNFVRTMLRLAEEREQISVVGDQRGNPTNALDLADGIIAVAANLIGSGNPVHRGLFHISGRGDASWAEFAGAIFACSAAAGGPIARVVPISTYDYPTAARRPANSRLDGGKLDAAHGVSLPAWQASLTNIVERLVDNQNTTRIEA